MAKKIKLKTHRGAAKRFKRTEREGVQVRVNDVLKIDFNLEVGNTAETIEVKAGTPLIETNTVSLGQVVEVLEEKAQSSTKVVQLGDEVRVEGRLTESDPAKLRIGMDVELAVVPFRTEADGTDVMVFAFAPAGEG